MYHILNIYVNTVVNVHISTTEIEDK